MASLFNISDLLRTMILRMFSPSLMDRFKVRQLQATHSSTNMDGTSDLDLSSISQSDDDDLALSSKVCPQQPSKNESCSSDTCTGYSQYSVQELMGKKDQRGKPSDAQKSFCNLLRDAADSAHIWKTAPPLHSISSSKKKIFMDAVFSVAPQLISRKKEVWQRLGQTLQNRRKYLSDKGLGKRGSKPSKHTFDIAINIGSQVFLKDKTKSLDLGEGIIISKPLDPYGKFVEVALKKVYNLDGLDDEHLELGEGTHMLSAELIKSVITWRRDRLSLLTTTKKKPADVASSSAPKTGKFDGRASSSSSCVSKTGKSDDRASSSMTGKSYDRASSLSSYASKTGKFDGRASSASSCASKTGKFDDRASSSSSCVSKTGKSDDRASSSMTGKSYDRASSLSSYASKTGKFDGRASSASSCALKTGKSDDRASSSKTGKSNDRASSLNSCASKTGKSDDRVSSSSSCATNTGKSDGRASSSSSSATKTGKSDDRSSATKTKKSDNRASSLSSSATKTGKSNDRSSMCSSATKTGNSDDLVSSLSLSDLKRKLDDQSASPSATCTKRKFDDEACENFDSCGSDEVLLPKFCEFVLMEWGKGELYWGILQSSNINFLVRSCEKPFTKITSDGAAIIMINQQMKINPKDFEIDPDFEYCVWKLPKENKFIHLVGGGKFGTLKIKTRQEDFLDNFRAKLKLYLKK